MIYFIIFITIVLNLYLVRQLDNLLDNDVTEEGIWTKAGIATLDNTFVHNPNNVKNYRPKEHTIFKESEISSTNSDNLPNSGRRFSSTTEYLGYVEGLRQVSAGVPSWARVLSMPTHGYHSFNTTASDAVGNMRDTIPDTRHTECRALIYDVIAANVSVIIIFHNEARSTLLRTVHAVMLRTPDALLHEVILVDDASTFPWLREALDDLVERMPKTKLIRLGRRRGLIRARMAGARTARGEVLVFLDAHTEVNHGWLEPLLYAIHQVMVMFHYRSFKKWKCHLVC